MSVLLFSLAPSPRHLIRGLVGSWFMKKILGIIVLSLLLSGNVYSFGLPKDVGSGNSYKKSLEVGFKKHGVKIVDKKDGYPVRNGEQAVRFEVRLGDCGKDKLPGKWNDCKNDRQRHELSGKYFKGEIWIAYSIYLPDDFKSVFPAKLALGQVHQKNRPPSLMFQLRDDGYFVDRQMRGRTFEKKKLLDFQSMKGKWNDILIHANFTKDQDGFYKIWANNELKYKYSGITSEGKPNFFKFGVYQSFLKRYSWRKDNQRFPTQIVFYDEIRVGKSREDVIKNLY